MRQLLLFRRYGDAWSSSPNPDEQHAAAGVQSTASGVLLPVFSR